MKLELIESSLSKALFILLGDLNIKVTESFTRTECNHLAWNYIVSSADGERLLRGCLKVGHELELYGYRGVEVVGGLKKLSSEGVVSYGALNSIPAKEEIANVLYKSIYENIQYYEYDHCTPGTEDISQTKKENISEAEEFQERENKKISPLDNTEDDSFIDDEEEEEDEEEEDDIPFTEEDYFPITSDMEDESMETENIPNVVDVIEEYVEKQRREEGDEWLSDVAATLGWQIRPPGPSGQTLAGAQVLAHPLGATPAR